MTDKKHRTSQQQKAIEVYCDLLADAFNSAGLDLVAVLEKKQIGCDWDQDSVKNHLFKKVMSAVCYHDNGDPKESTTELNTNEVDKVYKHLDRWTGEQFGIHVPFPSEKFLL